MHLLAGLRQLRYPKEFRIGAPIWSPDLLLALEKLAQRPVSDQKAPAPQQMEAPRVSNEHIRFLAEIGTGLWRLRQKMVKPGTGQPLEEMRRAYRHFEATWDVLRQAGIEIQDHTGASYDPGMALKVITFEPTLGITREKVTETIKPTIYFKTQPIQVGEVIVGTPRTSSIEPDRKTAGDSKGEQIKTGGTANGQGNH
jgi:hypothetical protein